MSGSAKHFAYFPALGYDWRGLCDGSYSQRETA